MFTGIIQAIVPVCDIKKRKNLSVHYVILPKKLLLGLTIGTSIAHNGCCLTVTNIQENIIGFDLIQETLTQTNLSTLKIGDLVNLERAATFGSEISGHYISGHIFGLARLTKIVISHNNQQIWFSMLNQTLIKYILYKGYISLDGISLTIGEVLENSFCVYLIPETIRNTTLSKKPVGSLINVEIDQQTYSIINTVERIMDKI